MASLSELVEASGYEGAIDFGECEQPDWCSDVIRSTLRQWAEDKDAIMPDSLLFDARKPLIEHLAAVHGLAIIVDERRGNTTAVFVEAIATQPSVDAASGGSYAIEQ